MKYIQEIKQILAQARQKTYQAINSAMVEAYWNIGKRICRRRAKWKRKSSLRRSYFKNIISGAHCRIW